MGFFPAKDPVLGDAFSCDAIDMTIVPRTADLGGLTVRRARLSARRRDRLARALRRGDLVPHAHRRGAQGGGGVKRRTNVSYFTHARRSRGEDYTRRDCQSWGFSWPALPGKFCGS
jgi:hypothetical protein